MRNSLNPIHIPHAHTPRIHPLVPYPGAILQLFVDKEDEGVRCDRVGSTRVRRLRLGEGEWGRARRCGGDDEVGGGVVELEGLDLVARVWV